MKLLIDIPDHIYEHAKESSEDSRDEGEAMRAIANGIQQESRSEIPNTCGDAISRAIVQEEISKSIALKENPYQMYKRIQVVPSVTSQQRTGRWILHPNGIYAHLVCDKCLSCAPYDCKTNYCPDCGAKMEVEE